MRTFLPEARTLGAWTHVSDCGTHVSGAGFRIFLKVRFQASENGSSSTQSVSPSTQSVRSSTQSVSSSIQSVSTSTQSVSSSTQNVSSSTQSTSSSTQPRWDPHNPLPPVRALHQALHPSKS